MAIKLNPKELIDDLVAMGYTRTLAVIMAREESARRHKTTTVNEVKSTNDYNMSRRGLYSLHNLSRPL